MLIVRKSKRFCTHGDKWYFMYHDQESAVFHIKNALTVFAHLIRIFNSTIFFL